MEYQSAEYKQLLGIKSRLEKEIETYRRLLDGEGGSKLCFLFKVGLQHFPMVWKNKLGSSLLDGLVRRNVGKDPFANAFCFSSSDMGPHLDPICIGSYRGSVVLDTSVWVADIDLGVEDE
ncbi:hypothetical protein NDU88_002164 [Pleurodeles waltl]|uniref:IF rod domain-containing protein n=1 Tax=Pleurodeles waltl TaxID=8319 RepID=A0AAV7Q583_PLEWA|nr:hypothetical protein NDU88_002164 [Pleurodeles waltl]